MYLTYHMTSQNHLIEGSSELIGGTSSQYVTTLTSSLINTAIVIVEI